jgi:hypothetical protein
LIIDLSKSNLFTKDPDIRFAKEYGVPEGTWLELWRRYKLLDYSNGDLRDYLFVKCARNLSYTSMDRWIQRTEIYERARIVLMMGATMANTSIFGEFEQYVMNELTRNIKPGVSTDSRSII